MDEVRYCGDCEEDTLQSQSSRYDPDENTSYNCWVCSKCGQQDDC